MKPTLPFVIVITALVVLCAGAYVIGSVAIYNQQMDIDRLLERASMVRDADYRPDISHCVDGDPSTDIWCCVTGKEAPCLND